MITVPFAVITSWINVLSASLIKRTMKSVRSLGESAIMLFISIAFLDGLKLGRFARLIIDLGNSKNMESEK